MKEMTNMTMTRREFTNAAKRFAKEYWGITLDIPIKWETHPRRKKTYAFCNCRRSVEGKGVIPTEIVFNIPKVAHLNDEQLLNILKHELCHWACMKRNRPYSDGSVFFEKELLRIGATSSKLDQASKDVMEKSVAYQKSIINPTIIKGTISNLHPYRIYKAGQELYRCDNSKEWVKQECKAYTVGLRKYEWFIRFSFEIDGEHYCGHLYRKPEGNWSVAKTSTEKFWKEGDYDRKLKFDRNLLKSLKEQMITNIYKTFEELGIGD